MRKKESGRRPRRNLLYDGGEIASDVRVWVDGVRVCRGPEAYEQEAEAIFAEWGPVAFEEARIEVEQVAGVDQKLVVGP